MLAAWPGMIDRSKDKYGINGPHIILPLTENADDKS
jgi:hypothetical protein